jgi:hypothetical protein
MYGRKQIKRSHLICNEIEMFLKAAFGGTERDASIAILMEYFAVSGRVGTTNPTGLSLEWARG